MKIVNTTSNNIKLFHLIFLVSFLAISGCFPLAYTVRPEPIQQSALGPSYSAKTDIMVIPVWGKFTGFATDETNYKREAILWLGDPVFTDHGSLNLVHDKISFKINTALIVGPGGAIVRSYGLHGYIIISQSGGFVLLDNPDYTREPRQPRTMTNNEKNMFIEFVKTGDSDVLKRSEYWWFFSHGDALHHNFSNNEKNKIFDFLDAIEESNNNSNLSE